MPVFVQLVIVPFQVECMFVEVQKLFAIYLHAHVLQDLASRAGQMKRSHPLRGGSWREKSALAKA